MVAVINALTIAALQQQLTINPETKAGRQQTRENMYIHKCMSKSNPVIQKAVSLGKLDKIRNYTLICLKHINIFNLLFTIQQ